jgi:hypothetical protein
VLAYLENMLTAQKHHRSIQGTSNCGTSNYGTRTAVMDEPELTREPYPGSASFPGAGPTSRDSDRLTAECSCVCTTAVYSGCLLSGWYCRVQPCIPTVLPRPCAQTMLQLLLCWSVAPPQPTSRESLQVSCALLYTPVAGWLRPACEQITNSHEDALGKGSTPTLQSVQTSAPAVF